MTLDLSLRESAGSVSLDRLVRLSCLSFWPVTEKANGGLWECADASDAEVSVQSPRIEQMYAHS